MYGSCLHLNILMKFVSQQRGQRGVSNGTKHERVCSSVTEKNDRATYFPNAPRIAILPTLAQFSSAVCQVNHVSL